MAGNTDPLVGQNELFEVPRTGTLAEIDLSQVVTLSKLITRLSVEIDPDIGSFTEEDLQNVAPANIEAGLYVINAGPRAYQIPNLFEGVVFPADQIAYITKSPHQLADRAQNGVSRKRQYDPEVAKVTAARHRAAIHAMDGRIGGLESVQQGLKEEYKLLKSLWRELKAGGKAHYRRDNLSMKLAACDMALETTVQVSAGVHGWDKDTRERASKALNYQLYGWPGHNNRRMRNRMDYTVLAGKYNSKRAEVVANNLAACRAERAIHEPFVGEEF